VKTNFYLMDRYLNVTFLMRGKKQGNIPNQEYESTGTEPKITVTN
jgi:hypothetical protein